MNSRHKGSIASLGLLALVTVYIRTGLLGIHWKFWDLGIMLERIYRTAAGELIYRDFDCFTTPLTYFLHAAALKIFGLQYGVLRVLIALQGVWMACGTFYLARRFLRLDTRWSAAAGLLGLLWSAPMMIGIPFYDIEAFSFCLLAAGAWCLWWERPSRISAFLLGLSASLAFWCKQDIGGAAIVLTFLIFAASLFRVRRGINSQISGAEAFAQLACWTAGTTLPWVAFGAYFYTQGALNDLHHSIVDRAIRFRWQHRAHIPFLGKLYRTIFGPTNHVGKLLVLPFTAAVLFPLWGLREKHLPEETREKLLRNAGIGLLFGGIYYGTFLSHNTSAYTKSLGGLGLAIASLASSLQFVGSTRARRAVVLLAGALILLSFRYIGEAIPLGERLTVNASAMGGMRFRKHRAQRIDGVIRFLNETVPPEEPVFLFPGRKFTGVYFATRRQPPQPITSFIEALPEDKERILTALAARKVRWIITMDYFYKGGSHFHLKGLAEDLREDFEEYARIEPDVLVLRKKD